MNHLSDRELSCVSDLLRNMTSEIGELVILGLREPEVSRIKEHLTQLGKQYLKESRSPARQCRYDMTPDERRQASADPSPKDAPQDDTRYLRLAGEVMRQRSHIAQLDAAVCQMTGRSVFDGPQRPRGDTSRNLMDLLGQAHEGR